MAKIWKYTKLMLKLVGVLFVATLVYFSPNIYHIYKWNPVVTPLTSYLYSSPETQVQARLDDIHFLRKLQSIDNSFTPAASTQFHNELNDLKSVAASISDAEFALAAAHAVALADNGHTNISANSLAEDFNLLPVKFHWFNSDLHIVRAAPDYQHLLGAKVNAIGSKTVSEASVIANSYFGGPQNWRQYLSTVILESPALLNASGVSDKSNSTMLNLTLENGRPLDIELAALPPKPETIYRGIRPWMVLSEKRLPQETSPWHQYTSSWEDMPLYLSKPDTPYFVEEMEASNGLYIYLSFMLSYDEHNIYTFWEELNRHIADKRYKFIILDLRNNPGGDYNSSVSHVAKLPDHLESDGKLFVATTNATFSAAIVSTSVAKFHGGEQTQIIGTRVGDRDQFWAEGGFPFKLPNSQYRFSYATGYHDWVNGCADTHPLCFSGNEGIVNPIRSLDPDIHVPLKFEDYKLGKDTVMERILEIMKPRTSE